MSSIDERVVKMEFDNAQFEKGAGTTMSTLAKLKNALKFDKVASGLQNLASSAGRISFSGLANSISAIESRFSTLGIVGMTAIQNITTSVMGLAKQIGQLSVQSITSGFQEYETQIGAVQTILANTQSKGTTIDDVNAALDELNRYADQTIYNFTEMTRNIGTFTAAGVDLDSSVQAIKGIANLAAVSGSTSQQAATAMYQLSQALAAGRVSLMDWNSVVNAGMGGEVFQTALKRTAENMGYNVDYLIEKYGSFRESLTQGGWLTADVLTETLAQISGAYTEADLLAQGYSESQAKEIVQLAETAESAATDVKTFTQLIDTSREAMQSGWTQTWEIILGDFEEAKSLFSSISAVINDTINEMSESRNELLEGAFGERTVGMADWSELQLAGYDMNALADTMTQVAREHGVAIDEMIAQNGSFVATLSEGWLTADIFSESINRASTSVTDATSAMDGLRSIADRVIDGEFGNGADRMQALADAGYDYATVQQAVNELLSTGSINLENYTDEQLAAFGYIQDNADATNTWADALSDSGSSLSNFINELSKPSGRELMIETLGTLFERLSTIMGTIGDAWRKVFPPATSEQIYGMLENFSNLVNNFQLSDTTLTNLGKTFEGLFSIVKLGIDLIKALADGFGQLLNFIFPSGDGILSFTANIGDFFTNLRKSVEETDAFGSAISYVLPYIENFITGIKDFFTSLDFSSIDFSSIGAFATSLFDSIVGSLPSFVKSVTDALNELFGLFKGGKSSEGFSVLDWFGEKLRSSFQFIIDIFGNFSQTLDSLHLKDIMANIMPVLLGGLVVSLTAFSGKFRKALGGAITNIGDAISSLFKGVFNNDVIKAVANVIGETQNTVKAFTGVIENIGGVFEELQSVVKAYSQSIRAEALLKIAAAVGVLVLAIMLISTVDPERLGTSVSAIALLFAELVGAMYLLGKSSTDIRSTVNISAISLALIGLGAAMLVMAQAVKSFAKMDTGGLIQGVLAVGALMAAFVGFSQFSKGGMGIFQGTGMILMATSLLILYNAVKWYGELDRDKLIQGGLAVAACLTAIVAAMNLARGGILGAAAVMVMVAAITALVPAISLLGLLPLDVIVKGLIAIAGGIVAFGVAAALLAPVTGALLALAGAFALFGTAAVMVGSAVSLVAGGLTTLAALGTAGAAGLTVAITAMVAAIGPAIKAVGEGLVGLAEVVGDNADEFGEAFVNLIKAGLDALVNSADYLGESLGQLLDIIIDFVLQNAPKLADALFTLFITAIDIVSQRMPELVSSLQGLVSAFSTSVMDAFGEFDTSNLVDVLLSMGVVVAIFGILAGVSSLAKKALPSAVMMLAVFGIVGAVFGILGSMDVTTTQTIADSLSKIMLSLSISTAILSLSKANVVGALQSVAAMAIVIAGIGLILAALGGLYNIEGVNDIIADGGELLSTIGSAIGDFGGSIIAGFGEAVTSSLPTIGENLSGFTDNASSFFDTISGLDSTVAQGAAYLAAAILAITASNVISGLTSWLTGDNSMADFGDDIAELGPALKTFSDSVNGINGENVLAASQAAIALVDVANNLPKEGGLAQAITGVGDLKDFSEGLVALGPSLVQFSNTIANFNSDAVAKSEEGIKILTTLAKGMPNTGGLVDFIFGANDMGEFATGLTQLGAALAMYSVLTKDITADSFTGSTVAAQGLVDLANELPDTGGLVSFLFGDNDIASFGEKLKTFGQALVDYSSTITGLDADAVSDSATAAQMLADLNASLPETGGIKSWFTGDNSIETFGKQLKKFGQSLVDYSDKISGIDTDKLSTVSEAVVSLGNLATDLAGKDMSGLANLNSALSDAGTEGIQAFIDGFTESVSYASVETAFLNVINRAYTTIVNKESLFETAGQNVMGALRDGISWMQTPVGNSVLGVCSTALDRAYGYYNGFYSAGLNMMAGLSAGIFAGDSAVTRTASIVASNALEAVRKTLDINSPSRKFMEIGKYSDEGLARGLLKYSSRVTYASKLTGERAVSAVQNSIANIAQAIDNGIGDSEPTIRPVLDLSNVQNGSRVINGMFGNGYLSLNNAYALNGAGRFSGFQRSIETVNARTDNSDIVSAIDTLTKRIDILGNDMQQIKVVMDTGALVGQMSKPMDRSLGMISYRKERGL